MTIDRFDATLSASSSFNFGEGVTMRAALKWIGIVLAAIIGIVLVVALVMIVMAGQRLNKTYDVQAEAITLPSDEASLARGEHIVALCRGCHGENLGGGPVLNDPSIGIVYAPNLTAGEGGVGATFSNEDFVRAIRHGVQPDGRALMIMPSEVFIHLSEEDLSSIIAYLRTVPPVDNKVPERSFTPMAKILLVAGMFGQVFPAEYIDQSMPFPDRPEIGANAAYGEYLSPLCKTCHGEDLSGGPVNEPGAPNAPNLTPGGELIGWTEADFLNTMHTGVTPSGHELDSKYMPVDEITTAFADDELRAIWMYLESLPALSYNSDS
jgi:cytochrome c553